MTELLKSKEALNIISPHEYELGIYEITEKGLTFTGKKSSLNLVRGGKDKIEEDGTKVIEFIQGFTTEQLLGVCHNFISSVNTGEFKTNINTIILEGIEQALKAIEERNIDRRNRNVQSTYKK